MGQQNVGMAVVRRHKTARHHLPLSHADFNLAAAIYKTACGLLYIIQQITVPYAMLQGEVDFDYVSELWFRPLAPAVSLVSRET